MLYMDLEYCRGVLFVRLDGCLTKKNTSRINNYLAPVIQKHQIKYLVYNLLSVSKVDESGIDAILRTKYEIKKNQGTVYLCEVPEHIKNQVKRLRVKQMISERMVFESLQV